MKVLVKILISLLVIFLSFTESILPTQAEDFFLSWLISAPDPWHTSGNAGSIWFYSTSDPSLTPYADTGSSLHGVFWSKNIWWITFDHWVSSVTKPYIDCPLDTLSWGILCDVYGYAWSSQAWWIQLWYGLDSSVSDISRVEYSPDTLSLSGYGYSPRVGWIPFEGISLSSVPLWFQGKVYIIGNIGGKNVFDTTYNPLWEVFDSINFQDFINAVKKQVTEMSRGYIAWNPFLRYKIIENEDYILPSLGWEDSNIDSYIVVGGDIIIEWSVPESFEHTKSLIALRNTSWEGWDIIIKWDIWGNMPDRLFTSLIAEGSIISWEKNTWSGDIRYYIDTSLLNIPTNQLFIQGIVVSRNTIGWAARSSPICPYIIESCTRDIASRYDFNYFRNFTLGDEAHNLTHKAYLDTDDLDGYSLVIRYDPRLLSEPPPGIDTILTPIR
jgi:hypothetical protein